MLTDVLAFLGGLALFLGLHVLTLSRLEPVFPRAFKLSRGLAALVLTSLGAAAFVTALPHWDTAFLYRHADGDWMRRGLLVVQGHLVADFVWMYVGKRRFGIQPRKDLVLHHALGLVAFSVALALHIGYALALITMITELLPLTTGVDALAKRISAPALTRAAARARLHVLTWMRIPLWIVLLALVLHALLRDTAPSDLVPALWVSAAGLVALLVLDAFWTRKCLQQVDFY